MKHLYQNEATVAGDVVEVTKNILQGKTNWIKYSVILLQKYRYQKETKTRTVLIDFFKQEDNAELDALKAGDNIAVFGKINSRQHEGKYYTSINGSGFVMVLEAEKEKEVEQTNSQSTQGTLDNQDDDEEIPF